MKILLTGGSGFIGKNILESFLVEKYTFLAPTSSELDVSNQESVDRFFAQNKFDIVIHSAGKPGHRNAKDHSNLLNTNVRMFYNLIRHQDKFQKFINLGSGAIYDMRNYQSKMKEEHAGANIPIDDHGLCKYIVMQQSKDIKNFIDLRVFGIFGKYEDYSIRFISNAICKAILDLPITLRQNRKFDYLFIEDLMPILDFFIQNEAKHKAYNITPDRSVELLELAHIIKKISGKVNLPIIVEQSGLGMEYSGDNSRLNNEMRQLDFTALEKSIARLYQWYQNQHSDLDISDFLVDK